MQTRQLSITHPDDLIEAASLLKQGELVAVPTETVYGLAADATNPDAIKKIFIAKNRPVNHPLITHISSPDVLSDWAKNIPDWVPSLVEHFWPGPLTLILEKQDWVTDVITGGHSTIGLRMPNHTKLLELLTSHQLAIAAPSANPYQKLSPTSAQQVLAGLNGKIAAVLDGGPCKVGTESTILSVINNHPQLLRTGAITVAELQPYIPILIDEPKQHNQAVSGNKEIHYQPSTPVYLKSIQEIEQGLETGLNIAVITTEDLPVNGSNIHHRNLSNNPVAYRHDLYATLFALDQLSVDEIWVQLPPQLTAWGDINDRLAKASHVTIA